jgi:ubiquinone/menaquinone biosynthesis C-methylase UbiE
VTHVWFKHSDSDRLRRLGKTYDDTRGASGVLKPLLEALGPPAGRSLLDIGGGTATSRRCWRTGASRSRCAITRLRWPDAAQKLGAASVAVADAHLPFRDEAFDCAISVNVLGHVEDWRAMLREARRIRGGPTR